MADVQGSLVAALRSQARLRADHVALIFLADGHTEAARLSYAELDRRARAFAAHLQQLGLAERHVLLMLLSVSLQSVTFDLSIGTTDPFIVSLVL